MSTGNSNPPLPAVPASPPNSSLGSGVRRHHTISASSRAARNSARETISEESQNQDFWNDDEVVDDDWVGGVGAVGEKSSLHRQASLPTKYHRAFQPNAPKPGNLTPKTMNSLTAIAGHEGDEEEWEREIGGYSAHEEEYLQGSDAVQRQGMEHSNNTSPLSPYSGAAPPHVPSPPPAASGVRRHVSLTYGAPGGVGRPKMSSGLKRSGTLQTTIPSHSSTQPESSVDVEGEEEQFEYTVEDATVYDDEYLKQTQENDWRTPGSSGFSTSGTIDDVQRALSALELAGNNGGIPQTQMYSGTYGQSIHPPRFNPTHPPPNQGPGMRNNGNGNDGGNGNGGQKLQLVTDFDGRRTPLSQTIAAGVYQQQYSQAQLGQQQGASWDPKERGLATRTSNPNLQYGYQQGGHGKSASSSSVPSVPAIPQQYLQQQQSRGGTSYSQMGQQQGQNSGQTPSQPFVNTPVDVPSLIAAKGYNPQTFDTRPAFARYFVIKSYTEDDVHKSLKYEIWSSTDPGNKRLDKAFKECAGRGPIYLFFSVNGSGHFCGMAEMLTPVDYTRSSTVWASDKWKGVFKVRWIFVRDIPNISLRHIKLNNTQERKPVTNSRDTQELLPDAGMEMLRIFFTHPARTSLLQDFAFYELQAMQKVQAQSGTSSPISSSSGGLSPPLQSVSPVPQQGSPSPQQALFNMQSTNPNALAYQMPQMTPMMQMQMQMGMGMMPPASQFNMAQTQAMHQSVMRHPSPAPPGGNQQGFMGF